MPQMPWEKYQQQSSAPGPWQKYASVPDMQQQDLQPTKIEPVVSPYPKTAAALDAFGNFTKGIGKGALSTISNLDTLLAKDTLLRRIANPDKTADLERLSHTQGFAQKLGKGAEQIGEFMLPGPGEEKAIAALGGGALARLGTRAVSSGAVNKAQGGSFLGGAAAGAAGEGVAQGLKKIAPDLAEVALRVRGKNRGFGAEPGRAILDETTGITPESVASSGKESINRLGLEKQALLAKAPDVDITDARAVGKDYLTKANLQGHVPTYNRVDETARQLLTEPSGNTIPAIVPATRAGSLQRGLGEATTWDPSKTSDTATAAGRALYGQLGQSIEGVAPEVAPINSRIHSLLPVVERAKATGMMAGLTERLAHKAAVHTGALTGAYAGGQMFGPLGAVAGFLGPELLASPTTYLAGARIANSPALSRLAVPSARAAALQLFRPKEDQ